MARIVPWTQWKPYRFFPWIEWRVVAGELETMPGVPIDAGTVWTQRRWRNPKWTTDTEQAGAQAGGVMTTQFYVRTGPDGELMPTDAPQVEIARIRKSLDNAMASRIEWRRLADAAEARALAAETALAAREVATDAVPVGWRDISTAPKDKHVLLCGRQIPDDSGVRFSGEIVTSGYWDGIDASWCMTGSTWQGPFIEPTYWMPLPASPTPPAPAPEASARRAQALSDLAENDADLIDMETRAMIAASQGER